MNELANIYRGKSFTIGFAIPDTYDTSRIEDVKINIGTKIYAHTIVQGVVKVELTSEQTARMVGKQDVVFTIQDSVFGVRKLLCGYIYVSSTIAKFESESYNDVYDVLVMLSYNEGIIDVDHVLFDYLRSKSPYEIAVEEGYTGTEEEFYEQLGSFDNLAQAAEDAKDLAILAQQAAEAAQGLAETAQAGAELAETNAETAQGLAQTAAITSTTQAGIATTQAGIATTQAIISTQQAGISTTKAGEAATSAQNATTSESNALASKNAAKTSEDAAKLSETKSKDSELAASQAKAASETARDESVSAKNLAEQAKTGAESARDKAQKWAENPEDVQVETGKYSSKHWATKALAAYIQLPNTERALADLLSHLLGRIDTLERLLGESKYNTMQVNSLSVVDNIQLKGADLFRTGTAAPSIAPDFIGQFFIDTTAGVTYQAKGITNAADWKATSNA